MIDRIELKPLQVSNNGVISQTPKHYTDNQQQRHILFDASQTTESHYFTAINCQLHHKLSQSHVIPKFHLKSFRAFCYFIMRTTVYKPLAVLSPAGGFSTLQSSTFQEFLFLHIHTSRRPISINSIMAPPWFPVLGRLGRQAPSLGESPG